MIVRQHAASELLLITQPDHAALAARLMQHWRAGDAADPDRRATALFAAAEHDNGWREPDAAPIVDPESGRILDFIHAPADVRRGVWPRGTDRLAATPYAAALVAQHAITIYNRYLSDPDWQPFFSDMSDRRDRFLARARRSESELRDDYFFVRMGDLLSLIICNGWTDEHRYGDYRLQLDGATLLVHPDPFVGRSIRFEVSGRPLPDRPFASADDARRAFAAAPVVALSGAVTGA